MTAIYSRPNNFIGFEGENVTERKYQDSDFANPKLFCDVIMKGGITSGAIYPLALAELAKRYRFSNIGGTSAGAIAAAAAEYGRNVPGKGFLRLTTLPAEAGAILFTLFQPTATVKPLFNILVAALGRRARPAERFVSLPRRSGDSAGQHWLAPSPVCWSQFWHIGMAIRALRYSVCFLPSSA